MARYAERARRGITRYTDSDLGDLRAFQISQYGARTPDLPTAHLEWMCLANPDRSPEGYGLWIARRDGRIVGQQGEIAYRLRVGTEELRAATAIELMVDPAWRLRGLGPALSATGRLSERVVTAIGMTDNAFRMYESDGWVDLGEIARYLLPLRFGAVVGVGLSRTLKRAAIALLMGYANIAARLCTVSSRLVPIDQFDERADVIWNRSAGSYPVLACRSARDLRWRFDEGPHAHLYRRFYVVRRGEPIGYIVSRTKDWGGVPALKVVDYLCLPRATDALFAHCVLLAHREGHAAVELITRNRAAHRRIRALGFIPAPQRDSLRFMVAVDEHDPLRAQLSEPLNWFVTGGDGDLEFIDRSTSQHDPARPRTAAPSGTDRLQPPGA